VTIYSSAASGRRAAGRRGRLEPMGFTYIFLKIELQGAKWPISLLIMLSMYDAINSQNCPIRMQWCRSQRKCFIQIKSNLIASAQKQCSISTTWN